jgi:hypothetical protein
MVSGPFQAGINKIMIAKFLCTVQNENKRIRRTRRQKLTLGYFTSYFSESRPNQTIEVLHFFLCTFLGTEKTKGVSDYTVPLKVKTVNALTD